eukprot:gene12920-biopygen5107
MTLPIRTFVVTNSEAPAFPRISWISGLISVGGLGLKVLGFERDLTLARELNKLPMGIGQKSTAQLWRDSQSWNDIPGCLSAALWAEVQRRQNEMITGPELQPISKQGWDKLPGDIDWLIQNLIEYEDLSGD